VLFGAKRSGPTLISIACGFEQHTHAWRAPRPSPRQCIAANRPAACRMQGSFVPPPFCRLQQNSSRRPALGARGPFSATHSYAGRGNATMHGYDSRRSRMAPAQAHGVPAAPDEGIVPAAVRTGIAVEVNGERFVHTGDPRMPLLWYLRDVLRLTGTKYGGAHGENGADLVLVDNKPVSAVTLPMAKLAGKRITTVEGLAANDGTLHPLQQAFIDEDAIGCGYCTPGWLIAAVDLLARKPRPDDADIDQLPNTCRCGCQTRVRAAIKRAATGKAAQA
jgi:isoquinoline 1-oxidoreductase alpha subunit